MAHEIEIIKLRTDLRLQAIEPRRRLAGVVRAITAIFEEARLANERVG